jgi:hypothetical protein
VHGYAKDWTIDFLITQLAQPSLFWYKS